MKAGRVVLATVLLGSCGYGAERCVVHPLVVTSRYKAYVREHPVGSTARDLAAAPFVGEADLVDVRDEPADAGAGFVAHGAAFALAPGDRAIAKDDAVAKASALGAGTVTFGWTTLRPFGRELFIAEVREGRVAEVKARSLD